MLNFKFSLVVVSSVLIVSVNALKCWECDGYDRVANQCSPENRGQSVECAGPNPMCSLIEEKYHDSSRPLYYIKKCESGADLEGRSNTCDSPVVISSTQETHTHCYCNDRDDCNQWTIAGKGSSSTQTTGGRKNGAVVHSINNLIIFSTVCVSMFFLQKQW